MKEAAANVTLLSLNSSKIRSDVFRYASIAAVPLSAIGLLANLFIFIVLSNRKRFSQMTYTLIRISVVSDGISCISSLICYCMIGIYPLSESEGRAVCRTVVFTSVTSYAISMMTLAMIAIERYFAIIRPFSSYYRNKKNQIVAIGQLIIWIISASISVPTLFFVNVYPDSTEFCDLPNMTMNKSIYLYIFTFVLYFVPTFIIVGTYWKIIQHQMSHVRPGNLTDERRQNDEVKRKQMIKVLVSITAYYILTTWPFFAGIIGLGITQKSGRDLVNENIAFYLLYFFSMKVTLGITILSPFLYLKFDKNILDESKKRLRGCWKSPNQSKKNNIIIVSGAKPTIHSISTRTTNQY